MFRAAVSVLTSDRVKNNNIILLDVGLYGFWSVALGSTRAGLILLLGGARYRVTVPRWNCPGHMSESNCCISPLGHPLVLSGTGVV